MDRVMQLLWSLFRALSYVALAGMSCGLAALALPFVLGLCRESGKAQIACEPASHVTCSSSASPSP